MKNYKIVYIDESEDELERFQNFCYQQGIDVIAIIPKPSLEETCNEILESHPDAVTSDFQFHEQKSSIKYNGTELVKEILNRREKFPVFIFTSFQKDALRETDDVNIIYEKESWYLTNQITGEVSKNVKLLERIKLQIEKYKHKLETDENRLLVLIAESKKRKLNALELEELSELDSKIEKALDKESRIPNILRNDKEASDLSELLKKVDELAKKLDSKK